MMGRGRDRGPRMRFTQVEGFQALAGGGAHREDVTVLVLEVARLVGA